ncbi:MAG: tetratricopeptide repeat protein [Acidobacteriota bacterium]
MSFLSLVLLSAALAQGPSPEQLYNEGVRLAESGDFAGAIAKYEELLRLRPDVVEARSNLGVALARLGRYQEAVANYRLALERDPGNATVRLNLALALYKQAEFAQAAAQLEKLPKGGRVSYLLADCYLRLGRNKDVIALLTPGDPAADYLLGIALIRDGQIERGQAVIDRILARGDSAEANLLLGAAQLSAGEKQKALEGIRKAIGLNPNLPGIWSLYGRAQAENDDHEGAKASFRKALEADPNDFDANLRLGVLLRRDNDLEGAAACIERAVRLRPADLAARFQMGSLNAARGKLEEARKDLEAVALEAPDFQEVHVQLAALYYRLNRKEDGRREREIVLKLDEKERRRKEDASKKAVSSPLP